MAYDPGGPDLTRPSPARVYDCLLGGKDGLAPDRALAAALTDPQKGHPGLRALAKINRQFILKAVTWCAGQGIRQFIDVGCGIPSAPDVHQVARASAADCRVAYIDCDPVVIAHVRALSAGPGIAVAAGDAADPEGLLGDPALKEVTGPAGPVAVLFGGTLSALDAETARAAVRGFMAPFPAGSAAVISCATYRDEALAARMAAMYAAAGPWRNHSGGDVASFFAAAGLQLVRGQVADVRCWPMMAPRCTAPAAAVIGGVGISG